MAEYTIKDLEMLSGILAHTLRIWEKRYGIIKPSRTDTNRRRYDDSDLKKIINVSILNRNGLKISKIASLTDIEIKKGVEDISRDISKWETQIDALVVAMLELDEKTFNDLLSRLIVSTGFENTFTNIVFPFLKKTGVLWQTGSVNPAQEHFISNIIRQKIISSIDGQNLPEVAGGKKVLMYLPEKELHEIGLLYYSYLAKQNGHEVLYLGQLTPFESVVYSDRVWNADIIVTGTLSSLGGADSDYVSKISEVFKEKKVILTGQMAELAAGHRSTNIYTVKSSEEFLSILNS
ncbi:MAG: MerR family transcriptional regulator [Marinilabiliaceae bacterium]|jgi:DNA-binding transcriptional MerR regulator|nr:MerR family transcriptional regulator [Marinilabiliaceae bacterium]